MTKNLNKWLSYAKNHWKRLTLITVGLVVAFLIYRQVTAEPAGVTVATVNRTALVSDFSANGRISARKMADLKFYSPGKVSWLGVKNGDTVKAYQGVASLDTVALNAAYQSARNTHLSLQAEAERVLDSVKNHETDENFTQKAARVAAQSSRDSAYDAILAAQANLKNALLISPIAGTVMDTNDLVSGLNLSGTDIERKYIRIVDLSTLYFRADVDEIDYSKVKVGQEVNLSVDAFPGETCTGQVSFIGRDGEETSGGVVTFPTEVTFKNCNSNYAVGLNGQARFVTSKTENVLVIPKKYIVHKDGADFVWLQTGDTPKSRKLVPVTLGSTTSTQVEIKSGVTEGSTIVFVP